MLTYFAMQDRISHAISLITLISWPSLNASSSSHASGLGDMVGGS